ncbi:hypothetical protein L0F63_001683, partial [Massospora cicadina]
MDNAKLKQEAEAFQRVHPKEYLKKFLAKGILPDGREFLEPRGIRITPASISTANGSSVVRIGKTIVMCGVKAEISEPTGQIFNKKSLCIEPGQAVWCLYADVLCVSDAGNVLDAAILAMSTALKHTFLPSVQLDVDAGLVKADGEFLVPLDISCELFPLTFSIIEGGAILADPDTNEEELADGTLTLVLNGAEGKLAYMLKTGKASLSPEQLQNCLT